LALEKTASEKASCGELTGELQAIISAAAKASVPYGPRKNDSALDWAALDLGVVGALHDLVVKRIRKVLGLTSTEVFALATPTTTMDWGREMAITIVVLLHFYLMLLVAICHPPGQGVESYHRARAGPHCGAHS
jgi:hypothetical protein